MSDILFRLAARAQGDPICLARQVRYRFALAEEPPQPRSGHRVGDLLAGLPETAALRQQTALPRAVYEAPDVLPTPEEAGRGGKPVLAQPAGAQAPTLPGVPETAALRRPAEPVQARRSAAAGQSDERFGPGLPAAQPPLNHTARQDRESGGAWIGTTDAPDESRAPLPPRSSPLAHGFAASRVQAAPLHPIAPTAGNAPRPRIALKPGDDAAAPAAGPQSGGSDPDINRRSAPADGDALLPAQAAGHGRAAGRSHRTPTARAVRPPPVVSHAAEPVMTPPGESASDPMRAARPEGERLPHAAGRKLGRLDTSRREQAAGPAAAPESTANEIHIDVGGIRIELPREPPRRALLPQPPPLRGKPRGELDR
jgi:hypothetical protein